MMDQRPWWERLMDRDSPAGPVIVLVLLILAIGFVLLIGPTLDRMIEGEKPASNMAPTASPLPLVAAATPNRGSASQLVFLARAPQPIPAHAERLSATG
jgi:hypothetical protein